MRPLERAEEWVRLFSETHNELKAKLRTAKGAERAAIQERILLVTRACDLFLIGLSLAVTKELPLAVGAILREEFPSKLGSLFATMMTDIEPTAEFLFYDSETFKACYVDFTRGVPFEE